MSAGKIFRRPRALQTWKPGGRRLHLSVPRLLNSFPPLVSKSGAAPAGRGSGEARTNSGVASQIPKCEPVLRIRIRYRSGRQRCETCSLRSNTHKPEAYDRVLWTTRPSGSPACQLEQSRIRRESSQFRRLALDLARTQQLHTPVFGRDFDSHQGSWVDSS
jgi:hypothetical protein